MFGVHKIFSVNFYDHSEFNLQRKLKEWSLIDKEINILHDEESACFWYVVADKSIENQKIEEIINKNLNTEIYLGSIK